ncbi:MAG: DUF6724 family protein [Collinsella sp.]|jgi:hypothetical protein
MGKYILMSVYDPTQLRKKAPNGRSFFLLFGTRTGFAILFAGGILLFAILAFVMEKRTHKMYVDRGPKSEDEEDSFWD